MERISLIECPRDAMQGWPHMISTDIKIDYINQLLKVGFDVIDCGSFVSPKAIPQMADTKEVLASLDLSGSRSSLLTIVANKRGAEEAVAHEKVSFLGFPFSISETFQIRNTNSTILDSFKTVEEIQGLCVKNNKQLVVYLSMGFGNPYGDVFSEEIVQGWTAKISGLGVKIISIADTVGLATPEGVGEILAAVIKSNPSITIGAHLHSSPSGRAQKLQAAVDAGCRRFDSAMKGIGGCPMAGDELIGNMETEFMVKHFSENEFELDVDLSLLNKCSTMATKIFI